MIIQHVINRGKASVDDELGAKLLESDLWVPWEPPAPKKSPAPKPAAAAE